MVKTGKVKSGKQIRRTPFKWRWVLAAALLVSVAANLNFAYRVAYLDTNHPFRPLCFTEADGVIALTERTSERYREHVLTSPNQSKRLGTDDVIYISLRDWTHKKDEIWNLTRRIAIRIYFERTGKKLTVKEMFEMQTGHCKFIRKYVLEKAKDS